MPENECMESVRQGYFRKVEYYYTVAVTIVCAYLALSLLADLYQIYIYRHDAAYYLGEAGFFHKLQLEGRWINYFLYPVFSKIPGWLAVTLNIASLFSFIFIVSNRWVKNSHYALLISLLCIQVTPLMSQILWPASIMPGFLILAMSAIMSSRMPIYVFYSVFGVLLFGTLSYLYYLLPLVHLSLLNHALFKDNLRKLFFTVVPAWAVGFVSGYLFAIFIVFLLSGNIGLKIAEWRKPNYVNSFQDLITNVANSYKYLIEFTSELFSGLWRKVLLSLAILVALFGKNISQYIPLVILSLGIILSHFIVIIPVGIIVSFRSVAPLWLGFLVLMFFYPSISRLQYNLSLPIIMFMAVSLYSVNHKTLEWYSTITNTYHEELLRSLPLSPGIYKGVAFMSTDDEVKKMTKELENRLNVKRGLMENIGADFRWAPVANEAGFRSVLLCNKWHKNHDVCSNAFLIKANNAAESKGSNLYHIIGEYNNYLIIALNNFDSKKGI